jgi:hypothetical protein
MSPETTKKTAKKPAAKKASTKSTAKSKPRTAAQLRAEAGAKAKHAAELDVEQAKGRFDDLEEVAADYVRTVVDVPVGAALNLSEKVNELVEPWTDQASAEKKVKGYRADLTRTFKRAERRGTSARRKATTKARKTRNSLEREVRKQRKSVEKQIKTTNKDVSKRIDARVDEVTKRARQAQDDVTKRAEVRGKKAQELVDKVTEQLTTLV